MYFCQKALVLINKNIVGSKIKTLSCGNTMISLAQLLLKIFSHNSLEIKGLFKVL